MKRVIVFFIFFLSVAASYAQPIFTFGKKTVTKEEFLRAFNKYPPNTADRKKAIKDYLNLYINFKLKVQAALDAGMDKDLAQQNEVENFRKQIAENIINEQANITELVKEAFQRSQKDINLGQVLIEIPANGDTIEAHKKIQEAYKALKDGQDFSKVSATFSTDNGTRASSGNLGFITAFTLDYEFENIAYSLKPNTYSPPYRSKFGYHIFKNLGERSALGTRRVAQILIAFPPNSTEVEKNIARLKVDSVYNLVANGAGFEEMALRVSNDMSSSGNGGLLPEFGINTYDPVFEQAAFSLRNTGDISKPFATSAGYHILKLLAAKQPGDDVNSTEAYANIRAKVASDHRMIEAKKVLLSKQLKVINYKPAVIEEKLFFQFTDSALVKASPVSFKGFSENTVLFSFAKHHVKAGEWIKYVKSVKGSSAYTGKQYSEIYKEFLNNTANAYYQNNLEYFSADYKKQLKEFKEANLLFAIMEKKIWSNASTDTTQLLKYYNQHKANYMWGLSADALIITCANEAQSDELQKKLQGRWTNWREVTHSYGTQVTADSGRFELGQLPVFERTNFTAGLMTLPVKNPTDGTVTFNYIIKVYDQPEVRSFEDARGIVINDYQQVLEDKWIAGLKKRYPVKINTALVSSLR